MPNIKSSIRSVKTDAERRAKNAPVKSSIRTAARKVAEGTKAGDQGTAAALLSKASSLIDKAAGKGVIHKNTAARKKSRLAKRVNKMAE